MKKKPEVETKKETKKAIPLEYFIPDGIMTPFATNMLVQSLDHEFKISFYESKPPIRLAESDPLPDKVRADYVAGVIVSVDRLPKFIQALQTQLKKHHDAKTEAVIT